jgi:hypothetical protein
MEAVCSSETLVSTYTSIGCYDPEDQHRQLKYIYVILYGPTHLLLRLAVFEKVDNVRYLFV